MSRVDKLWDNKLPNVRVFEVPEAVKRKLLRYTPTTQPAWDRQNEFDQRPLPESLAQSDSPQRANAGIARLRPLGSHRAR